MNHTEEKLFLMEQKWLKLESIIEYSLEQAKQKGKEVDTKLLTRLQGVMDNLDKEYRQSDKYYVKELGAYSFLMEDGNFTGDVKQAKKFSRYDAEETVKRVSYKLEMIPVPKE